MSEEVTNTELQEAITESISALQDAQITVVNATSRIITALNSVVTNISLSGSDLSVTKGSGNSAQTEVLNLPDNDTVYSHPTSAGNKHIPAGGASGNILRWKSDGEAEWGNDSNTTYSNATQSAAGLMSATDKTKLDGIANSANNYSHPTSAGNKHIPSGGASGNVLIWKADGEAKWDGEAPVSWVKDELRAQVEKVSGGRRTVIYDSYGDPHFMVRVPKFNIQDIDASFGSGPHPMFIIDGQVKDEIFIGQYLASRGTDGKPKTLPGKDPWCSIAINDAPAAARGLFEKGGTKRFAVNTSVNFAGRALFLLKEFGEDHVYHGNDQYGRCVSATCETGVMAISGNTPGDTGNPTNSRTLTGTGPLSWYDDGTPDGLADLVGNVWEITPGLRLNEGEINVIQDNNAMLYGTDLSASSTAWKGILQNGNLVTPGTANTLKIEAPRVLSTGNAGTPTLSTTITNKLSGDASANGWFKDFAPASGVTVPSILKLLGLYPVYTTGTQNYFWTRNYGERLAIRGGHWGHGLNCGPFALYLGNVRSSAYAGIGFRLAFAA